jgi:hypothetical protein
LLLRPARESSDIKPLAGLPEQEVVAAFLALSPDQQSLLLSTFWERLKVTAMITALEKILDQPDTRQPTLRDEALRRLYQLDPAEATPRILAEITHPHVDRGTFTVKPQTLAVLPIETLPQFDPLLAARLEEKTSRTKSLDAQLIGRYSTAAILARVKAVYETQAGKWDCVAEDGFVLYFLRVVPDYGVARLAQTNSFCMEHSLRLVIRMKRWNQVEPAIIARLNDPELFRARQAAETLAKYGSPKAEKAMWERLRAFHRQWSDHEKDLTMQAGGSRVASDAMSFQYGLVQALGTAQAWLLSEEQVTELENLTLGFERDNVKQWRPRSPVPLDITILFDERLMASVNIQYQSQDAGSLCSKLAQYSEGTRFLLNTFGPPELLAPVLKAVNDVAAEHGLMIEPATGQ